MEKENKVALPALEVELDRISPAVAILVLLCMLLTTFWQQW